MDKISVLLADSSELIRIGLRTVLETSGQIKVIDEAVNGDDLLQLVKQNKPQIVLIDYTSNEFDIQVIPSVLKVHPEVKFVAITIEQSAQTIINAIKVGITSHIKKDCSASEIAESVIETAAGNKFFCGQILQKIREEKINVDEIEFEEMNCDPISLSQREMEVITHIAEGYTNTQVADMLFLSSHTVNTHRKNIMRKLGVNNTAGIVMYAVKTQLVSPNKFLFASSN
ncbi:MAG: DNA-binding NarL/FixJ family response regulator [Parvicellaceae bacterium]|jgi:DNA-binding NarL/FixJ family response regulator